MMKKVKILFSIAFAVSILTIAACGGSSAKTESESIETNGNEVTYTCSMHPEISQMEMGKCPECGMDLVAKGENPATDHSHE